MRSWWLLAPWRDVEHAVLDDVGGVGEIGRSLDLDRMQAVHQDAIARGRICIDFPMLSHCIPADQIKRAIHGYFRCLILPTQCRRCQHLVNDSADRTILAKRPDEDGCDLRLA